MRRTTGAAKVSGAPTGVTLLGYDVAMSLSPLLQRSHFCRPDQGTSEPSAEAITIKARREDRKPNWPRRELSPQATLNCQDKHSRFGVAAAQTCKPIIGVIPASFRVR